MRCEILAGYNTSDKTIILLDVTIKANNEFTMSASVGELIRCDTVTSEDVEEWLDSVGDGYIYEIMKKTGVRSIDEAVDLVIDEAGDAYRVIYDCSCSDFEIYKNDKTFNFNTICCGQCCEELEKHTLYKKDFAKLLKYWREYHLKTIPENIKKDIERIVYNSDKYINYSDIYEQLEKTFNNIMEDM